MSRTGLGPDYDFIYICINPFSITSFDQWIGLNYTNLNENQFNFAKRFSFSLFLLVELLI